MIPNIRIDKKTIFLNMTNQNSLTLIIPAKYESESLPIFLEELKNTDCRILIVLQKDDYKTIKSLEKFSNIKLLFQKINGYGAALIEGFNSCETEYCCIINADGSMDPKYLREMLKLCEDKDLVFGSRYMQDGGSEDDTIITFVGNKFFTTISNLLYSLDISDILYTYILGKTKSFRSLNLYYKDFRLCVEIPIKAKKMICNMLVYQVLKDPGLEAKKKLMF